MTPTRTTPAARRRAAMAAERAAAADLVVGRMYLVPRFGVGQLARVRSVEFGSLVNVDCHLGRRTVPASWLYPLPAQTAAFEALAVTL